MDFHWEGPRHMGKLMAFFPSFLGHSLSKRKEKGQNQ